MLKIQIIGHLGKDAFVNDVNGKKVINFSVAHSEKFTDTAGVKQEKTTWVDCAKWGDSVAVAPYLKKGVQVYVEGNPEARLFQRKDGTSGASLSCRVGMVQLLSGGTATKPEEGGAQAEEGAAQAATPATTPAPGVEPIDDLPF